jgi:hypothetical protein
MAYRYSVSDVEDEWPEDEVECANAVASSVSALDLSFQVQSLRAELGILRRQALGQRLFRVEEALLGAERAADAAARL